MKEKKSRMMNAQRWYLRFNSMAVGDPGEADARLFGGVFASQCRLLLPT